MEIADKKVKKVFVVDDDEAILKILKASLEKQCIDDTTFKVTTFKNGPSVIEEIERGNEPHVILLDYCMPVMDGREVLIEIKKLNPSLPVVFCTARSGDKPIVSVMKKGAIDYLQKPIDSMMRLGVSLLEAIENEEDRYLQSVEAAKVEIAVDAYEMDIQRKKWKKLRAEEREKAKEARKQKRWELYLNGISIAFNTNEPEKYHEKIKTKEDIEKIAKAVGKSVSTIQRTRREHRDDS